MFRVIVQVSCMIVLASVFYDVFTCNSIYRTHTYQYIKYVGNSRYGRMFLKKWKKARRLCFKSLGCISCSTPTDNRATVNQVEPCIHFADWPLDLKTNVISLIHYALVSFGEKMSSFQHSILSCNDLMTVVKVIVAGAYHQVQKCQQATTEFIINIIPLR